MSTVYAADPSGTIKSDDFWMPLDEKKCYIKNTIGIVYGRAEFVVKVIVTCDSLAEQHLKTEKN